MIAFILMAFTAVASGQNLLPAHETIWDVKAKAWITPAEMAAKASAGNVWVLGEEHATPDNMNEPYIRIHHDNHLRLLELLSARGLNASVGLEFLPFTADQGLQSYLAGALAENEFRTLVSWGGEEFSVYRQKMIFPYSRGGKTVGLNVPRRIARKVSKHGPNSLNSAERQWVPDNWQWGATSYFERFSETMNGHVAPEKIRNYFWAQTLWDDTMAWSTARFMRQNPDHVLAVVVGMFHAEFKDGLPARMTTVGVKNVRVILQEPVEVWDMNEIKKRAQPDAKYGHRADFLWFYKP